MAASKALRTWFQIAQRAWGPSHAEKGLKWIQKTESAWRGRSIGSITTADVLRLRGKCGTSGYAARMNTERGFLRAFFNHARNAGWTTASPEAAWEAARYEVARVYRPLDRAELEAVVQEAPPWLARFVRWAAATGMRPVTLLRMRWGDVGEDEVAMPGQAVKTGRAVRVPVSREAVAALGPRGGPGDLVFPEIRSVDQASRAFRALRSRPPNATLYDLRRTWVKRMREAGLGVDEVAVAGGWKSVATVVRYYTGELSESTKDKIRQA